MAAVTVEKSVEPVDKSRRLARFFIGADMFAAMLLDFQNPWEAGRMGIQYLMPDIPADIEIVHVGWDFAYLGLDVVCRSATFEIVPGLPGDIPVLPKLAVGKTVKKQ